MRAKKASKQRISQLLGDALLGLALFALMAGLLGDTGRARAEPGMWTEPSLYLAAAPSPPPNDFVIGVIAQSSVEPLVSAGYLTARPAPMPRPTITARTMVVLALVFSALFALNVGFWRHLRRTYFVTHSRSRGANVSQRGAIGAGDGRAAL